MASIMIMVVSCVYKVASKGEFLSKTLFKDANEGCYYVKSEEAKSIMNASDIFKGGFWLVHEPGKMGFSTTAI